jgi:hypothetical protein
MHTDNVLFRKRAGLRSSPWQHSDETRARVNGQNQHLPDLGPHQRSRILDAAAIAAYHAQTGFPVVELLICDDAPQFKLVTDELALYKNITLCSGCQSLPSP